MLIEFDLLITNYRKYKNRNYSKSAYNIYDNSNLEYH